MDLTFNSSTEVSSAQDKDFRVVVLCQDAATTDIACDVLLLLRRHLENDTGRLLYQWWTFEFLAVRELWELFAAQTASAAMIIFGVQEEVVLPEQITAWLNQLPDLRNQRPGALIAVLAPALNASAPGPELFSQLKQAAVLSRMDFFATRPAEGLAVGAFRTAGLSSLPTRTEHVRESAQPDHSSQPVRQSDSEAFREEFRRRRETPFRGPRTFGGGPED